MKTVPFGFWMQPAGLISISLEHEVIRDSIREGGIDLECFLEYRLSIVEAQHTVHAVFLLNLWHAYNYAETAAVSQLWTLTQSLGGIEPL